MAGTLTIGQKAAQSLYYSFGQAERIGRPLNQLVTLNFAGIACCPTQVVVAFRKLRRDKFNKWLAGEPTGIYAFENRRDEQVFTEVAPNLPHNLHVHWALHVAAADALEFAALLPEWVEACVGRIIEPTAVNAKELTETLGLRSYLNKGAAPQWAGLYGATAKPQGRVIGGRRTGTTLNIGRTARIEADKALGIRRRIPHVQPARLASAA